MCAYIFMFEPNLNSYINSWGQARPKFNSAQLNYVHFKSTTKVFQKTERTAKRCLSRIHGASLSHSWPPVFHFQM
jgi:hypothetical protein